MPYLMPIALLGHLIPKAGMNEVARARVGLGQSAPWTSTAVSTGTAIGTPLVIGALGIKGGAAATTAGGAAVGASVAAAAVTAGVALAGVAVMAWISSARRRGAQKVAATSIVDEAAPYLQDNLDAWKRGPRTLADTVAALEYAQAAFDYIRSEEGCGNRQLGSAGERCIAERVCREGDAGCRWPWIDYYATEMKEWLGRINRGEIDPDTGQPPVPELVPMESGNGNGHGSGNVAGREPGMMLAGGGTANAAGMDTGTSASGRDTGRLLLLAGLGVLALVASSGMDMGLDMGSGSGKGKRSKG